MIPFLSKKDEKSQDSAVTGVIKRKPDDGEEMHMLEAVAEDMLAAMKANDKEMLKQALEALVEHIKEEDEQSDQQLLEGHDND